MSRQRAVLLSMVTMFVVSMLAASAASAAGPFWHVNEAKLKQGSVGVKLQSKGPLSLKGAVSGVTVTITCNNSTSDATIDGQGETKQGQGKGFVKYTSCKVETLTTEGAKGSCAEPTTITTNQLKSHLAEGVFQGKAQIVELFEPIAGPTGTFVEILLGKCTPALLSGLRPPVKGSVVAGIAPQEAEGQEGSLIFPAEPIKKIKHEGQEPTVSLTLNGTEATFTGFYGARIQSGTFGVFRT